MTNDGGDSEFELGVEVTRARNVEEAHVIAALLRSCGIEANVAERWRSGVPEKGSIVYVREHDLALAKEILEAPTVDNVEEDPA
jgi:hypothetical protein